MFLDREKKQGLESDSDRDTDAAAADSGENEVRKRNMRECEDAMMEDTASRRGYAPTAAWDEGNMIQAMGHALNIRRLHGGSETDEHKNWKPPAPTSYPLHCLYRYRIIARVDTLTTSRAVQGL